METLLTFTLFGSAVYGLIALSLFLIGCFLADILENGFWATALVIVIAALFFFYGKDKLNSL